jgi:hypothetical protein
MSRRIARSQRYDRYDRGRILERFRCDRIDRIVIVAIGARVARSLNWP